MDAIQLRIIRARRGNLQMKMNLSTNLKEKKSSVIALALGISILSLPLTPCAVQGQPTTNPAQASNGAPNAQTGANTATGSTLNNAAGASTLNGAAGTNSSPNLGIPNSAIGTPNTNISSPSATTGVPNSSIGTPNTIINTPGMNQSTTSSGTAPAQPWTIIRTPAANTLVPSNNLPDNTQGTGVLRGPLSDTPNTGTSTTSKDSANLLPTDTIPLGVDEFEATPTPLLIKGPVGNIIGTVDQIAPHKPCNNCFGVAVHIQNLSPNPIIVDGEHALVFSGSAQERALSEDYAMKTSGGMFTKEQKLALAATFVGTLGLLEPVLQDHFSTSKTDFPVSYGVNETRRRMEDRRLSKRIILPGEDTDGVIFFNGTNPSYQRVSIPIKTYPLGQPVGSLDLFAGADNRASQLEPVQAVQIVPGRIATPDAPAEPLPTVTTTTSTTTTVKGSSVKVKDKKKKPQQGN